MMFSVLISLYDKENPAYFSAALKSIATQTLQPTEVVLVVDGPIKADLEDVINDFATQLNIVQVRLPMNGGLGKALNEGLKKCSYELIARMDTDDIAYPDRFEKQIEYLNQNPHISVVGSTIEEFDLIPGDLKRFRKLPSEKGEILKHARYRNPLNHPTVVFKKSDVLAVGSYKHMPLFEDYYLWIELIASGYNIANIEAPLLHFRVGNDMVGRRHGISYMINEFNFLRAVNKIGFLKNRDLVLSMATKMPLRLLPKRLLMLIYKKLLR